MRLLFDDSIIQDAETEKERAMKEVAAGLMRPWEYRVGWYGESEVVARGNVGTASTVASQAVLDGLFSA